MSETNSGQRLYFRSPLLTRSRTRCSFFRRMALSRAVLLGLFVERFMPSILSVEPDSYAYAPTALAIRRRRRLRFLIS